MTPIYTSTKFFQNSLTNFSRYRDDTHVNATKKNITSSVEVINHRQRKPLFMIVHPFHVSVTLSFLHVFTHLYMPGIYMPFHKHINTDRMIIKIKSILFLTVSTSYLSETQTKMIYQLYAHLWKIAGKEDTHTSAYIM